MTRIFLRVSILWIAYFVLHETVFRSHQMPHGYSDDVVFWFQLCFYMLSYFVYSATQFPTLRYITMTIGTLLIYACTRACLFQVSWSHYYLYPYSFFYGSFVDVCVMGLVVAVSFGNTIKQVPYAKRLNRWLAVFIAFILADRVQNWLPFCQCGSILGAKLMFILESIVVYYFALSTAVILTDEDEPATAENA